MNMINQIAHAIAEADGSDFQAEPARYRRLAVAALQPLANPTDAMIDAAHKAASLKCSTAVSRQPSDRNLNIGGPAEPAEWRLQRLGPLQG